MNEQEMRDSTAPTPDSLDELGKYIDGLVGQDHDYGTCVYAMSLAATAAFNYVARKLGVTGFQASCADLDVLRRTRNLKGPFMFLDANDLLYPQYDIPAKVEKWIAETIEAWAAGEAKKLLDEPGTPAVDAVRDHWRRLASVSASRKEDA